MAKAKRAAKPAKKNPDEITLTAASKLVKLTTRRIMQLVTEGWIKKSPGRGGYTAIIVMHGYLDFLEDEKRRLSVKAAGNSVMHARAEEIHMRLAERKRELIPLEEAVQAMDAVVATVRSEFNGLAARVTRDRAAKKKIEAQVDKSFERISKAFLQASETVSEGGDVLEAVANGTTRRGRI